MRAQVHGALAWGRRAHPPKVTGRLALIVKWEEKGMWGEGELFKHWYDLNMSCCRVYG